MLQFILNRGQLHVVCKEVFIGDCLLFYDQL